MSHRLLTRRAAQLLRPARLSIPAAHPRAVAPISCLVGNNRSIHASQTRSITQSLPRRGLMPESENPPPKESEPHVINHAPTPLEEETYHTLADGYLDRVVARMEEVAEGREDVDVEYSAGVLSITFPPHGTYVLNKQPPNKQIWLSSPTSGPKRFDWVVAGESMDGKEGSGVGDWLYLRDGSSLTEILRKELGVSIVADEHV